MFNLRASIRECVLILVLTVVLASCGTPSTTAPPLQIATNDSNILTPTETNTLPQPTATLVSTEIQATPNLASEVDNLINSYVDIETFSGSVLIARDGEVLFSDGYGLADREASIPNTPQTKFRLGSITKQFTAAAILLLQEQGKLDVQDAICEYLSDCPPAWETVTIHHLLTHTSGTPNFTDFPEYASTRATPSPPMETINRFNGKPLDFSSGEDWSYSNSGYIVLGLIIEQVAGQPYETFLQESIFTPLNMTATGYDHNLNELAVGYARSIEAVFIDMSIPFAAGGLYSTVEDLYLCDQAIYNEALLTQDSLSEMFSDHAPIPGTGGLVAYGYGWFIDQNNGHRLFVHDGGIEGFVSFIAHYPDEKVTIILLSNLENSSLNLLHSSLFRQVNSD